MITSLILVKNPNFPKVIGAVGIKLRTLQHIFQTKSIIIACGGAGQLYRSDIKYNTKKWRWVCNSI